LRNFDTPPLFFFGLVANVTLQTGAAPVMAHENIEMTQHASALVLNMGTLDEKWLGQMISVGKEATRLQRPIVFGIIN